MSDGLVDAVIADGPSPSAQPTTMTVEAWRAEGERRFGSYMMGWRFVCPSCGRTMSVADYQAARAPQDAVAFNCVGRYQPQASGEGEGPCTYTGGGLLKLNPITVIDETGGEHHVFAFADVPEEERPA